MNIIIGTAGHIDHGKTTLIKKLTSIDTDRLKEEKDRGLSIDLGFAYLDLPDFNDRIGIVDVPGHERFIKNMLSGITGIDLVLFVVAADDGIMPQTREHLDIVNLLGVNKGIFVITKSDLVDKTRIKEVEESIKLEIKGTSLMGADVVSISSTSGDGIEGLKTILGRLAREVKRSGGKKIFRLPVDRSFSVKGFGTVVTGTVSSGGIKVGSDVTVFPKNKKPYRVRGLHSHGVEVKSLNRGQRGAVNLSSISATGIDRGDMLIEPSLFNLASKIYRVDCKFTTVKNISKDIKDNAELKLYHYSKEVIVKVRLLEGSIKKGDSGYGRLYLREPLVILRGDRFILRDTATSKTIGGGVCLLPYFKKQKLPKVKNNLKYFEGINVSDISKLSKFIFSKEVTPLLALLKEEYDYIINLDKGEKPLDDVTVLGDYTSTNDNIKYLEDKVIKAVSECKSSSKEVDNSLIFKSVYGGGTGKGGQNFLKLIIDTLVKEKTIYKNGSIYSASGEDPSNAKAVLSGKEKIIFDKFNDGFQSTKVTSIEGINLPNSELKSLVAKLQKNKFIVRLTEGVYIKSEASVKARGLLESFLESNDVIKVSDFRDLLGCGRKLTMELLDYFDREGITLRDGDFRKLRK